MTSAVAGRAAHAVGAERFRNAGTDARSPVLMRSRQSRCTTLRLRDGSQQVGLDLTVEDKLRVAAALDALGVDVVEGGWPGSNPKDKEFFARAGELPWVTSRLAAFGATRRPNRAADGDGDLAVLLAANTPIVTLVGKSWTLHVDEALRTTREENLAMVADSARFFAREGRRVVFDAEHFFDGLLRDASYALDVLAARPLRLGLTRSRCVTPMAGRCPMTSWNCARGYRAFSLASGWGALSQRLRLCCRQLADGGRRWSDSRAGGGQRVRGAVRERGHVRDHRWA